MINLLHMYSDQFPNKSNLLYLIIMLFKNYKDLNIKIKLKLASEPDKNLQ